MEQNDLNPDLAKAQIRIHEKKFFKAKAYGPIPIIMLSTPKYISS